MIGPCMPHQRTDAAPAVVASVADLATRRRRKAASEINAACPGWAMWYSEDLGQWIAHRCGNWSPIDANFGTEHDPTRRRLFALAAADPEQLRVAINCQALLDLDADHPDWDWGYTDNGEWSASWAGGDDGLVRPQFFASSPVRLSAMVREYVAFMEEPGPCPAWW